MNDNGDYDALIADLLETCTRKGLMVATAESCTGGLIVANLTSVAGSSAIVDRGFVTYSNEAKSDMLAVPEAMIEQYGAVSGEVAGAMAEGALNLSNADVAISVTGIAGPSGGSDLKPVGLVWFGCAAAWAPTFVRSVTFPDHGRAYIRDQSVGVALEILGETVRLAPEPQESG